MFQPGKYISSAKQQLRLQDQARLQDNKTILVVHRYNSKKLLPHKVTTLTAHWFSMLDNFEIMLVYNGFFLLHYTHTCCQYLAS